MLRQRVLITTRIPGNNRTSKDVLTATVGIAGIYTKYAANNLPLCSPNLAHAHEAPDLHSPLCIASGSYPSKGARATHFPFC